MNDTLSNLKEGTIIKKGYKIDLSRLDEGYLSDSIICLAESRNEAKKELLKKVRYDNWKLKYSDDELNYLNIPVIRCENADKIIFEGELVSRYKIELIKKEKERLCSLSEILEDPLVKYCYIYKGSYYCSNFSGYTSQKENAGIYTKKEAVDHAKSVSEIKIIPINIEEHNKIINDKINYLKGKILN